MQKCLPPGHQQLQATTQWKLWLSNFKYQHEHCPTPMKKRIDRYFQSVLRMSLSLSRAIFRKNKKGLGLLKKVGGEPICSSMPPTAKQPHAALQKATPNTRTLPVTSGGRERFLFSLLYYVSQCQKRIEESDAEKKRRGGG